MKERVLYFAVSGLGDNLFAVPALMELEQRYALSVVCSAGPQSTLFAALLPQAKIIPLQPGWGSALDVVRQGFRYDYWLYSIGSSFRRTRLINLLGCAKKRYAFTSLSTLNAWQLELGFDLCMIPDFGKHAWRNNYQLLTLLDPGYLKLSKTWDDYAAQARRRILETKPEKITKTDSLFIHAGCNKYAGRLERYKRWPVKHFLHVADDFMKKGACSRAEFFVGPSEENLLTDYHSWVQDHPNSGPMTLYDQSQHRNDLLLIAQRLIQSKVFVGNDSGIAHLAAMLGVPTMVVMSATGQPSHTRPEGRHSITIEHPVPCQGCTIGITGQRALQFECPNEWACMATILPDQVIHESKDLLYRIEKRTLC